MTHPDHDRLYSPRELAAYLGFSVSTLARWRQQGTGPPFDKLNGRIRYSWTAVEIWREHLTTEPTTSPGAAPRLLHAPANGAQSPVTQDWDLIITTTDPNRQDQP